MDANAVVGTAGFAVIVILGVLGVVSVVFWIISPFMLYAINQKLFETNRLLAELLAQGRHSPPTPRNPPPPPAEIETVEPTMFRSLGR